MAHLTSLWAAAAALLLATCVTADFVVPTNASVLVPDASTQPLLEILIDKNPTYRLFDLHNSNASELTAIGGTTDNGNLISITAQSKSQISGDTIAYISCDPADYPGDITLDDIYSTTTNNKQVLAVIFYSLSFDSCRLDNTTTRFPYVYSMTGVNASAELLEALVQIENGEMELSTRVITQETFNQQGGSSPSSSTATAMIILYSITGLITGLFVLIIISGAIRAHRHPERYGPRQVVGRTRQSRAKGLARAMLDTIPIVKFGEQETPVDKASDVELGSPTRQTPEPPKTTSEYQEANVSLGQKEQKKMDEDKPTIADGPGAAIAGGSNESTGENTDEGLGCSICTEDFEKGQDIRVLPCNHKFHPACVDPWLLDVSGTCPLCRVDLRPAEAGDENQQTTEEGAQNDGQNGNTSLPPPLDPNAASSPASRRRLNAFKSIFHWRRMEDLTPEERMEALRQYREQEAARRARRAERQQSSTGTTSSQGEDVEQDDRTRWAKLRSRVTRLR